MDLLKILRNMLSIFSKEQKPRFLHSPKPWIISFLKLNKWKELQYCQTFKRDKAQRATGILRNQIPHLFVSRLSKLKKPGMEHRPS